MNITTEGDNFDVTLSYGLKLYYHKGHWYGPDAEDDKMFATKHP